MAEITLANSMTTENMGRLDQVRAQQGKYPTQSTRGHSEDVSCPEDTLPEKVGRTGGERLTGKFKRIMRNGLVSMDLGGDGKK